ncbi:MAG TPA: TerC family protein [Methylomirabilota bacterium]|nr:TerC family protein [Methylomirabilota bacterium]
MLSLDQLSDLLEVIMVNVVLSGDNAIVVAMAAAGLPQAQRGKAMIIGIAAATGLRVVFALATSELYAYLGLRLAGGILLLWVCWKLWRELRQQRREDAAVAELEEEVGSVMQIVECSDGAPGAATRATAVPTKTFCQAFTQIMIADISMSLDNVLAVAGAARNHPAILIVGLVLSIAFMGVAATLLAGLLKRFHWISYAGLAVIFYVACTLLWEGSPAMMNAVNNAGLM